MKVWDILLKRHADRFLFGIDTYEPLRWLHLEYAMEWQQDILSLMPEDVARKIAYENGERLTRIYVDQD